MLNLPPIKPPPNKNKTQTPKRVNIMDSKPAAEKPQSSTPNLLFILVDDMGWGDLGYNNPDPALFRTTPNLDRLCKAGVFFDNFMVHHVCSPSRAGLLTGMHYSKVGAGSEVGGTLDNSIPNIAKNLQAHGYRTGCFGKWHNSTPNFPEDGNGKVVGDRGEVDAFNDVFENFKGVGWGEGVNAYGFDEFIGYYGGGQDYFNRFDGWYRERNWWTNKRYTPNVDGYTTDLITQDALRFIDTHAEQPFFCYVPMEAPHEPIQVKQSDLREMCEQHGQWEYMRQVLSPSSGRRIDEVEEIRCEPGAEFDWSQIDPDKKRFAQLTYAAMIYSMDKGVGRLLEALDKHNITDNTIIFFCSDNGGTGVGNNRPFRGCKHTLWEGGVHVPAVLYWPGHLEAKRQPYAENDNHYPYLMQYLDFYPTMMSMLRLPMTAENLDGLDAYAALRERRPVRADMEDLYYGIERYWGVIRNQRWKLHYNEVSPNRMYALYDLQNDVGETTNLAAQYPEKAELFAGLYRKWVAENNYAFSFMAVEPERLAQTAPAPSGDVLEVRAVQTRPLTEPDREGLYVRFSDARTTEYSNSVQSGDRIEFDIMLAEDSELDTGFYVTTAQGMNPYYTSNNGVAEDGVMLAETRWPRGKWLHKTIGIGNHAALGVFTHYIALRSRTPGAYHFYLDNVVLRKADGTIRARIWQDAKDLCEIIYRRADANITELKGTPFAALELNVVEAEGMD